MLKINIKWDLIIKVIVLIFIIMFFVLISQVSANSIESIDMDVYIDKNGNAAVTEIWKVNLTQGTEGYKSYTKLGNSKISNFIVKDQTGITYQSLSKWDSKAGFNYKAYKSGVNVNFDEVELCWGISNYGNNTYTLKYNISNFVNQYTDTQGIYFNFLNLNQQVDNVKITIYSNYKFSLDNARIWAFGNEGTINFKNGGIILESGGKLSTDQYMVALVRFENNIFNTSNISKKSFDDIYDSAMSSVDADYKEGISYFISIFKNFGKYIIFIILLGVLARCVNRKKQSKNSGNIEYAPLNLGKKIKEDEVTYYRDIPCNGDLYYAYWIMIKYKILQEEECKNGIIGAILLKWIKEGYIELVETSGGWFDFRDSKYSIAFKNIDNLEFQPKDNLEKSLIKMFKESSGSNNILEAREFEKWCKENHATMNRWFEILINDTTIKLQQKRLFLENITTTKKMWERKTIITNYVDNRVRNEALNLKGLKKFLLDYSLIQDRRNVEVHILEEYLVFAQLLGIADKVEEQFSKLYPDFKEVSKISDEKTSLHTKNLSANIISVLVNETLEYEREFKKRAKKAYREYTGNNRSSGGGGSSYRSGGNSSGGSSGGGFR